MCCCFMRTELNKQMAIVWPKNGGQMVKEFRELE